MRPLKAFMSVSQSSAGEGTTSGTLRVPISPFLEPSVDYRLFVCLGDEVSSFPSTILIFDY